jgi:nicotinate-nucleotide pyrophosphorylase (carboxylating)
MAFFLDRFDLDAFIRATLSEDLGDQGDITSAAVIPPEAVFAGVMQSREAIVAAGLPLAEAFFRRLDRAPRCVRWWRTESRYRPARC